MRFIKSYCAELNKSISPYEAREVYFDQESHLYQKKLSFHCEDETCRVDLVAVNIYKTIRAKKASHYRTRPKVEHSTKCCFYIDETKEISGIASQATKNESLKNLKFPSEFLLERPKNSDDAMVNKVIEIGNENSGNIVKNTTTLAIQKESKTILKTSCLDHVIDGFLFGSEKELSKRCLTIGDKNKAFTKMFKQVQYFQDEKGLIYYGPLKEVKKYGNNYSLIFKKWAKDDDKSIGIYLTEDVIKNYRKSKLFLEQLKEMSNSQDEIICFFVGAYPVIDETKVFKPFKVEIKNLDHISLICKSVGRVGL